MKFCLVKSIGRFYCCLVLLLICGCALSKKKSPETQPSVTIGPPRYPKPPETNEQKAKRTKLLAYLSQIKGCYWVQENLHDLDFRKTTSFPPKGSEKWPVSTSMISAVYESNDVFEYMTLKPFNVIYLHLKPGNVGMSYPTEMIFNPESAEIRGNEYRSFFNDQVIDRKTMKRAIKEHDGSIIWKDPVEEQSLEQRLVIKGTYKTGLDIFAYQRDFFVFHLKLVPAKREDCTNEDFVEKGLRANDGLDDH